MDVASPYQSRIDGVSSCSRAASRFANVALATQFFEVGGSSPVAQRGASRPSAPGEGRYR